MLSPKRDRVPRPESADAMAYARDLAAKYQALETGYRNGRYKFIGSALTSYRKFLKDEVGYEALLSADNIAGLREKPDLKKTSRLVLYYLTGARKETNTAGKYARIVDYLHQEGIGDADAAEHIKSAGGIDEILKKARGREALKAADETLPDDVQDFEGGEEPDETRTGTSASGNSTDELFDPEKDLSIRVRCETLERVLGPEIDMTESFYLECKKKGPVGRDGIRIVGRLVDPPSA
jgi:hypothetical protein